MKKAILIVVSIAAILIILAVIFNRLEPLLGILGLGGVATNQIISKAKAAGKKAREAERARLSKMSDREVVDEVTDSNPGLSDELADIRRRNNKW